MLTIEQQTKVDSLLWFLSPNGRAIGKSYVLAYCYLRCGIVNFGQKIYYTDIREATVANSMINTENFKFVINDVWENEFLTNPIFENRKLTFHNSDKSFSIS